MSTSSHSQSSKIENESIQSNRAHQYGQESARMKSTVSQSETVTDSSRTNQRDCGPLPKVRRDENPEQRKTESRHLQQLQEENDYLRRQIEIRKEELYNAEYLLQKEMETVERLERELLEEQTENSCIEFDTEREIELLDWFKSTMRLDD